MQSIDNRNQHLITQGHQIVFIESDVPDLAKLIADAYPGTEMVILDANQDGLQQMAALLAGRSDIDAIHIFSHGTEASLNLGTLTLDATNLDQRADHLAAIGNALSGDGDILLYGCNVSAGADGAGFIAALAAATGADVAASNDLTGAARLGGNWVLESQAGQIDTASMENGAFDAVVDGGKAQWTYDLPTVASETTLSILDSAGRTVWSGAAANNGKGSHTLDWDGKDLQGRQVSDGGTYRLKIEAKDLQGNAMNATASVTAIASRLQAIDGQTLLTVGKIKAPLTAVTGVQTAPS